MKCQRCGYQWKTKSTHIFVSCPSCLTKVRNTDIKRKIIKNKGDEEDEKTNDKVQTK